MSESDSNADRRSASGATLVVGFHEDDCGHWVVTLTCGHTQHLRHQPPWQSRAWVLDPARRHQQIGQPMHCGWCARNPQRTKDS
ncbi:DUF3565 domain-containing protein [Pseudomonas mangrovi]|uniref:DUF3565 domain-containing protein n=1 Tax=Pseudomonas mangrovi TaxID=2161748 RepID=A0A2T5PA58_9PSED|nr:DUF3565 domain-containing protein [Pseudomonas mangrovi]